MNAFDVMNQFDSEQGWSQATKLELALRYIDELDVASDFGPFLRSCIEPEHAAFDACAVPLRLEVQTYHGGFFSVLPAGLKEYGAPRVRVTVEKEQAGVRLLLGPGEEAADLFVERRTDRWVVVVWAEVGGEVMGAVHILDDARVVFVNEPGAHREPMSEVSTKSPPALPIGRVRYKPETD
jgi:hypothetical protein